MAGWQGQMDLGPPQPTLFRLFFALQPPRQLLPAITEATAYWVRQSGGRPTQADNLHVTLTFMTELAMDRLSGLLAAAGSIRSPAFSLALDRVATWPNGILFLEASTPPSELQQLVDALVFMQKAGGFPIERATFRMHMTLARDIDKSPFQDGLLGTLANPVTWQVDEFFLIHSRREQGRAVYDRLGKWPLGQP